jgi:hypothetical protein
MDELVVTSNKLTNNFAGLVTSGLGSDVARGPLVLPRCHLLSSRAFEWRFTQTVLLMFLILSTCTTCRPPVLALGALSCIIHKVPPYIAAVAQAVQCLTTDRTTGV